MGPASASSGRAIIWNTRGPCKKRKVRWPRSRTKTATCTAGTAFRTVSTKCCLSPNPTPPVPTPPPPPRCPPTTFPHNHPNENDAGRLCRPPHRVGSRWCCRVGRSRTRRRPDGKCAPTAPLLGQRAGPPVAVGGTRLWERGKSSLIRRRQDWDRHRHRRHRRRRHRRGRLPQRQ